MTISTVLEQNHIFFFFLAESGSIEQFILGIGALVEQQKLAFNSKKVLESGRDRTIPWKEKGLCQ